VKLVRAVSRFCKTITLFEIDAFRIYLVSNSLGNNNQKVASITDQDMSIIPFVDTACSVVSEMLDGPMLVFGSCSLLGLLQYAMFSMQSHRKRIRWGHLMGVGRGYDSFDVIRSPNNRNS
jgi:hypothetical protein